MKSWRALAVGILLLLALAACNAAPGPSDGARPTDAVEASVDLPPPDPVADQLGGAWRRSPIVLDDPRIAVLSDACATQARESLDEDAANLPTVVVDARGEGSATVIMADDLNAILCLVSIDASGVTMRTTVDRVDRLRRASVEPVDGSAISLAGLVHFTGRGSERTLAYGRIGPGAFQAKVGFDDASVVPSSTGDGWWAMWWRGDARPASISAVDRNGLSLASANVPDGEVEGRIGSAEWWIDPNARTPTAKAMVIPALVRERACASGRTPEGRIDDPLFELSDSAVIVVINVRPQPGDQDCPGNPPFGISISLPEPLGNRKLLDGSTEPPRDATKAPDS